jgi:hypothetical protein
MTSNTHTVVLPAQLLHAAAQFASTDETRAALTAIYVRPLSADLSGVQIESTDGNRIFRVMCSNAAWQCFEPMLIPAKPFKKKMPKTSRLVTIAPNGNVANILGGIAPEPQLLQGLPLPALLYDGEAVAVDSYPNTARIWEEALGGPTSNFNSAVSFSSDLMADFLKVASSLSVNGAVKVQFTGTHTPIICSAELEPQQWLETVKIEYLLMPIARRSR